MSKYRLIQEVSILDDDSEIVKEIKVHMIVDTKDIGEQVVLELMENVSVGMAELMQEDEEKMSEVDKCFEELNEQLMHESDERDRWF